MRALLLALSVFALNLLTTAPRPTTAPPRTARVDGQAVAYRVLGAGRPVLVLISGLGEGMASFDDVAGDLAHSATVIAYDRAGYGGSGIGSARTPACRPSSGRWGRARWSPSGRRTLRATCRLWARLRTRGGRSIWSFSLSTGLG